MLYSNKRLSIIHYDNIEHDRTSSSSQRPHVGLELAPLALCDRGWSSLISQNKIDALSLVNSRKGMMILTPWGALRQIY